MRKPQLAWPVFRLCVVIPTFALQLCVFLNRDAMRIDVYARAVNDRVYDPLALAAISLVLGGAIALFLVGFCHLGEKAFPRIREYVPIVADALALTLLCLLVFFPMRFARLDGQELPAVGGMQTLWQVTFRIALCSGVLYLSTKHRGYVQSVLNTVTVGVLLFSVATTSFLRQDPEPKKDPQEVFTLGREKNVILLMVETLQGNYVEELSRLHEDTFASFDGFTLFSRAVTSTVFSPFSVAQLLSGGFEWKQASSRKEVLASLEKDSLMTSAVRAGYGYAASGLHAPVIVSDRELLDWLVRTDNGKYPWLHWCLQYTTMALVAARRVSPAFLWSDISTADAILARRLTAIGDKSNASSDAARIAGRGQYPGKILARDAFLETINNLHVGNVDRKVLFNFNFMTHLQVLFDSTGTLVPGIESNKESQLQEYRFTLSLYSRFLNKLKAMGLYDSSLIIIVGDHGSYFEGNRTYNSALLIKSPSATGKLQTSDANILLTDLRRFVEAYFTGTVQDAFADLLRLSSTRELRLLRAGSENLESPREYVTDIGPGNIESILTPSLWHHRTEPSR